MTPAPDPQTDGLLLDRFRSGEAAALDELVERYQGPLLRFAGGLLRSPDRAEDVVQETFLRLIRHSSGIGSNGAVGPWMYRVCRNLAYDTMKTDTREMARREHAAQPAPAPGPEAAVEMDETRRLVARELEALPEKEREAVRLKVQEGLTYRQISDVTGWKVGTVGWLVHRGLDHLTSRLAAAQVL